MPRVEIKKEAKLQKMENLIERKQEKEGQHEDDRHENEDQKGLQRCNTTSRNFAARKSANLVQQIHHLQSVRRLEGDKKEENDNIVEGIRIVANSYGNHNNIVSQYYLPSENAEITTQGVLRSQLRQTVYKVKSMLKTTASIASRKSLNMDLH